MRNSRLAGVCLFLALLVGPAGRAGAQAAEEGVLFYGGTVLTPSRRAQSMEEAPAPVTVITRADIRRAGALTLPEILALAPGVDVVQRSEAGVEVSIRGFNTYSSNKVLVLLDSKPLFNLADASVDWSLLPVPVEAIERVEIVRGPGSALYGENAFFGTINIITRSPGPDSAHVSGGGGTGDSWAARAGASIQTVSVYGEHLRLNRFAEQNAAIPNELLDDLHADPLVISVNIDRAFFRYQPQAQSPSAITGGFTQVDSDYQRFRLVDRIAFVAWDHSFRAGGVDYELGMRVLGQDQRVDRAPFPSGPYRSFLRGDLELRGVYAPTVADVVVFGVTMSHRTMTDEVFFREADQEVRQGVLSGYVENELALADRKIFVTTGVRADGYQDMRGAVSPRAGLVFILSPAQSLKIGWGQAFRSPSFYELRERDTLAPPWVFLGNPGLRPESVSSWNLDYFYQDGKRGTISISLFHHELRDLIVYQLASFSLTERRYRLINADRATSWGGEIEGRSLLSDHLELWANYSYNEAFYHREHGDLEAPFSPRHKANLGLDYAGARLRLSVWGHYVGSQQAVNFDAPFRDRLELKDYGLVSARVELRIGSGLSLAVMANDLFGQGHYEAPNYAPVTPYYFVELRWAPEL